MDRGPGSAGDPPRWRREHHAELDSTQDELKRRLARGEPVHGLAVRADVQTAGRGRRGDPWRSGPGGCYQSVAVRWHTPSLQAAGLTLRIGVCLAEELASRGVGCMVKWPNDLFYRDRKLGGVLVESVKGHLMIGVGLNVRNEPPPEGIALGWTSVDEVAELVLAAVGRAVKEHASGGGEGPPLEERFGRFDWLRGRRVRVGGGAAAQDVVGVAGGIDQAGALLVAEDSGSLRSIHSGSVMEVGR